MFSLTYDFRSLIYTWGKEKTNISLDVSAKGKITSMSNEDKTHIIGLRPVLIIYTHSCLLLLILDFILHCFTLASSSTLLLALCSSRFKLQAMLQNPSKSVISKTECFSLWQSYQFWLNMLVLTVLG